jgi:transcriptional regulator with GAF, ATPase, and Fis domain
MDNLTTTLLGLWRLAASHGRLDEVIEEIAAGLGRYVIFERLLILELDQEQARLKSAAQFGMTPAVPGHGLDPLPPFAPLRRWCLGDDLVQGRAEEVRQRSPGLVPASWTGDLLAVGLASAGEPLGALLLGTDAVGGLGSPQASRVLALREPIAVALRNHLRLKELTALREAAEADRRSLLARLGRQEITDTLIGGGSGLREVMRGVELVAPATAPVLILGETGSGKEVIARAIHVRSSRAQGPFLRVNCGAIPPDLVDSELFGHERGSFTGAANRRLGWFERADRGTLFLDEIGELTPAIQVRLLRILQDGTFERVGGQHPLQVDVRLIAATHRDLQAMVREGDFREDLWYRINVFPIQLPALRERPEDIPTLSNHFAQRAAERLGLTPRLPTPTDLQLLRAYPWPGNVRELASVIERAAILGDGQRLEVERALGAGPLSPASPAPVPPPSSFPSQTIEPLEVVTRRHIERALAQTLGRVEGPFGTARLLDVHPDTLRSRMRKLGIEPGAFRPQGRSSP